MKKDIDWFKEEIAPNLSDYELDYKFFEKGDFGSLNQVEFNSDRIGGNVDFWGNSSLGILVWDFKNEKELLNILLNPEDDKEEIFNTLKNLLDC